MPLCTPIATWSILSNTGSEGFVAEEAEAEVEVEEEEGEEKRVLIGRGSISGDDETSL